MNPFFEYLFSPVECGGQAEEEDDDEEDEAAQRPRHDVDLRLQLQRLLLKHRRLR